MTYKELAELCLRHKDAQVLMDIIDDEHVIFYNPQTGDKVVALRSSGSHYRWFFKFTECK